MSNKWKHKKGVKHRLKKYKKKKNKSSLAIAIAEKALRKAEDLEDDVELKFSATNVAGTQNNNIGQIWSIKHLNNYCQDLTPIDFYDVASGQFLRPPDESWTPCIYCPIMVKQGLQENYRIGNDITMSHLTIKGQIQAWTSDNNIGANQFVPVIQTVHMLVILDKDPTHENTTAPPYSFQMESVPFQLMPVQSDAPLLQYATVATEPNLYQQQASNVFVGYKVSNVPVGGLPQPPLMQTRTQDLLSMCFQSKDFTNCVDPRFKILMHKKYRVQQGAYGGPAADSPYRYSGTKGEDYLPDTKMISETIKAPYKFHFAANADEIPVNQAIYVAFCSDTPCTHRPSGSAAGSGWTPGPTTPTVIGPHVSCSCRFSYRDA